MELSNGLSVFVIICVTFAQDVSKTDKNPPEGRDLRDYINQDWKALDYVSPTPDTSGWIAQHSTETEDQTPRRRRIRKRKRRPPIFSLSDADQTYEDTTPFRKRIRPQRLDQIREPWEDMSDEINQRSYSRRRLTPVYDEIEETTESRIKNPVFEKIRDPFTALQEAEEKQKKKVEESTMSTPDLKALLKQSGGLSLSEVLQQKNLSLAELLKGNQQAISALARQTEATTETAVSTDSPKYRRLPPSVGLKKVTNRNFEHNYEQDDDLTSHEVLEAQRKRLALLHGHKDTKMFSDVTRFDVVTEETTEKRIFVPSNSKFYTSVDYKPEILFKGVTTTPVPTTTPTAKAGPVSFRSRTRELPLTSAKLNKFVSKSTDEARIPAKAVTININEIFGFSVVDGKNSTEASDGPFKMTIDLGEIVTTEAARDEENVIQIKTVSPVEFSDELKITTATSIADKLKHVTAKEEIMEILKNPADREYLSRILQTRNMTVEELVEQRERGSSQLHLADIFHNKTREPEPKDEPFIGHINSANFNSFPFFNRKSKSRAMSTTSKPPLRTDKQLVTTKPPYTITSFPTFKIETNKNFKTQPFLPVWKQLYPSLFTDVYENNHYDDHTEFAKTTTPTTRKMNYDLESLEDIENTLAEAANSKRNLHHQNIYDDNEFISLPTGVKSAILASLAIIGLSLLVFLTILVVFKWTQKQKRRLNYNGSFSGSKIKSPILEPDQKRSFKMFMTETLGRKKNYYKSHLQSMSDTIWDDGEKKSYMI